jgi:hypothetical protein
LPTYDADGDRTQLAVTIDTTGGDTADFVNNYQYDALGEMKTVTQQQQAASQYNGVAEKRVDFGYNLDGDVNSQLSYEVYVYSSTGLTVTALQDTYSVTSGGTPSPAADPTDTPLGDGWYDLGSVPVSASTSALTVTGASTPTQVCLLQQTSATARRGAGPIGGQTGTSHF